MKTKSSLALGLLLFLCNTVLRAQETPAPDLSDTWKLHLEKSKISKNASIHSEILVIKCSGLSIQIHSTTDGKESTQSYTADGKERILREVQGGEVVVKARWKKTALTIETSARLKMPDQPYVNGSTVIHTRERWTLSGDGRLLTEEFDDPKSILVYEKQ